MTDDFRTTVAKAICRTGILAMKVGGVAESEETANKRLEANWHHWKDHYEPIADQAISICWENWRPV
jgi:hypothetical protein